MMRRFLACSSPEYFTPKLSTTRANAMGKVEFVQRLGVFSVGAYPWEGEDGFQFRMGEDSGLV